MTRRLTKDLSASLEDLRLDDIDREFNLIIDDSSESPVTTIETGTRDRDEGISLSRSGESLDLELEEVNDYFNGIPDVSSQESDDDIIFVKEVKAPSSSKKAKDCDLSKVKKEKKQQKRERKEEEKRDRREKRRREMRRERREQSPERESVHHQPRSSAASRSRSPMVRRAARAASEVSTRPCSPHVARPRPAITPPGLDLQPAVLGQRVQRVEAPPATPLNPCVFMRYITNQGDLLLEKISDVAVGVAMQPLGCTYFDGKLGFLFTAGDSIRSCSETGELGPAIVSDLHHPTAICVMKPSESFAVLDNRGIHVYSVRDAVLTNVADKLNARGLAYTADGLLLTVNKISGRHWIQLYDPRCKNKVIASLLFPTAPLSNRDPNPSFCAAHNNTVFITDLYQNCLLRVNAACGSLRIDFFTMLSPPFVSNDREFKFISGVACDSRYELLVADAARRTLWSFTGAGDGQRRVRIASGSFPYAAAIAVSPRGYLLACGRQTNSMVLFKFIEEDPMEDNMRKLSELLSRPA